MHQNIMRTNLILINFEFMVCVDQMNTEYQQDKFFWRLVDVMLWISGCFVHMMKWYLNYLISGSWSDSSRLDIKLTLIDFKY